jgi:hypothetical protein
MMKFSVFFALVGAVSAALIAMPANAQATRTWVSGVGDDVNPCSRAAPCQTFVGAISRTVAAGEISVLDPGGFGSVTITKAITTLSEHVEASVLVSGANGIVLHGGPTDGFVRDGLDIKSFETTQDGVRVSSGPVVYVVVRLTCEPEAKVLNNLSESSIPWVWNASSKYIGVSDSSAIDKADLLLHNFDLPGASRSWESSYDEVKVSRISPEFRGVNYLAESVHTVVQVSDGQMKFSPNTPEALGNGVIKTITPLEGGAIFNPQSTQEARNEQFKRQLNGLGGSGAGIYIPPLTLTPKARL